MGSIIETLNKLAEFQAGIKNLGNIIPDLLNDTQKLSKELEPLSRGALKNLHTMNNQEITPPAPPTAGEDPEALTQIQLALIKSTPYEERSSISYSGATPEIGEGYQFHHGIFKDNLNSSYIEFIRTIDKEFKEAYEYSGLIIKEDLIPKIKEDFSSWLSKFNSTENLTDGAIPIENIQKDYKIPLRLLDQTEIDKINSDKSLAVKSSLRWLDLANSSLMLLNTINKINTTDDYPFKSGTLSPYGTFEIGELKKFLLKEMAEKFTSINIAKLINLCKSNQNALGLHTEEKQMMADLKEEIKDFKPDCYECTVSNLDPSAEHHGIKLNVKNIDYIEGFFEKETKNPEVNIGHLCAILNGVHQSYIQGYPQEGYVGDKDRYKIASQILNIVQLVKKQSTSETQEKFINSLEAFYIIEKENTASLY